MKKLIAEAFGTAVLVLIGCGSVAVTGYASVMPLGILPISLAFGLAVTAMAYAIGPVSGCHINPAVTMAMITSGRMSSSEGLRYMGAQVLGAFIGAGLLAMIVGGKAGAAFGQTTFDVAKTGAGVAFLVEFIVTLIFTAVILGATQAKGGAGALAGLIIGLTLAVLHLVFVPVTGISANPARSIAPNVYVGGQAAMQLWLYILAPLLGGAVAGLLFKAGILSSDS
ncbi:GlpF Glycerol uptake facilitator and related permeases (Major Intrinsic Protein Family) [Rhabdaerophilaceae bacterium]